MIMNNNIVSDVYKVLAEGTNDLQEDFAALNVLDDEIKSHRYSDYIMKKEIIPKRYQLEEGIKNKTEAAINKANALVADYEQEIKDMDILDASQLTDDIKLFQPGISLTRNDLEAIMKRNSSNKTMIQIAERYAKEHNIPVGISYVGTEKYKESARNLRDIIKIYSKWMKTPSGPDMLEQFFEQLKK